MKENYFTKLIKYINNVYHIDKQIEHVTDERNNPTYKTAQIISLVLIGFLLRIKRFAQLNLMIKAGEFNNIVICKSGILKINAIRSTFKSFNLNSLRKIDEKIIKNFK